MRQKLGFAWSLMWGGLSSDITEEAIEELLKEDMWALIQAVLGKDYPQIVFPLLHERNVHLARCVHRHIQDPAARHLVD